MSVFSYNNAIRRFYAREDDALGQSLLGEGQALRELFRCPVVHNALLHSNALQNLREVRRTIAMLLGYNEGVDEGCRCQIDVECLSAGLAVSMVTTSALARRDAEQGKRARAAIGRMSRVYKEGPTGHWLLRAQRAQQSGQ